MTKDISSFTLRFSIKVRRKWQGRHFLFWFFSEVEPLSFPNLDRAKRSFLPGLPKT